MLDKMTDEKRRQELLIWGDILDVLKDELDEDKTKGWTEEQKSIYILTSSWIEEGDFLFFRKPKQETVAKLIKLGLVVSEGEDEDGFWLSILL